MYIQVSSSTASSRLQKLLTANQMVEASIPQVYWTGYESLILVSAHFIAKWGVNVSKDPMSSLFPRRWLDIKGNKVPSFWHAALRSVMGSVIFRPGISQVNILNTPTIFSMKPFFLG
jgi:oxalate---CoA ligase